MEASGKISVICLTDWTAVDNLVPELPICVFVFIQVIIHVKENMTRCILNTKHSTPDKSVISKTLLFCSDVTIGDNNQQSLSPKTEN